MEVPYLWLMIDVFFNLLMYLGCFVFSNFIVKNIRKQSELLLLQIDADHRSQPCLYHAA